MNIRESIREGVAIVALKGDLLDDKDCLALQQKITSLNVDGVKRLVFDLRDLRRLNSNGLGALIKALRTMRESGGDIRCAHSGGHIKNLLVETKLVRLFRTFETVGRAQASYAA